MAIINYQSLRNKRKRYITRRMVALILGKTTQCTPYEKSAWGWLRNIEDTELEIDIDCSIEFSYYNKSKKRYKKNDVVVVRMKKLPEKVANLLAIVHRPLFEIYKKYLKSSKLERDK